MKNKLLKYWYCYLLLITAFTPSFMAYNSASDWLELGQIFIPFLLSISIIFIIFVSTWFLYKKHLVRTVNTTILLFLFLFLYRYIYIIFSDLAYTLSISSILVHSFLIFFAIIFYILIYREQKSVFFLGSLVHIIILPAILYNIPKEAPIDNNKATLSEIKLDKKISPDIFYTIPDCYSSNRIIQNTFNFDNNKFAEALESEGFYISDNSQSNYLQTRLSLTSSLNLNYIDKILNLNNSENLQTIITHPAIENNLIARSLKNIGYDIFHTKTTFPVGKLIGEEIKNNYADGQVMTVSNILLTYSIIGALNQENAAKTNFNTYDTVFESLATFLQNNNSPDRKPLFVFSHLILPHSPFLVNKDGNFIPPLSPEDIIADGGEKMLQRWRNDHPEKTDEYFFQYLKDGYINNVKFFNKRFLKLVSYLKENHNRPYIIVVQGDHGCSVLENEINTDLATNSKYLDDRSHILNAYYFFDKDYSNLSKDISPVNSFRVIFNQYFNADLDKLEHKTLFSTYDEPFKFQKIPAYVNDN